MDVRYPTPPDGDGSGDGPDADGPPPPPVVREREARRRRRRGIVVGAVAAVLLFLVVPLLVGGAFLLSTGDEAAEAPADGSASDDPDGAPGDDQPGDDDAAADGTPGDGASEDDTARDDGGAAAGEDPGERPDREVPAEERVTAPDLAVLDADDTRIAELLLDIDASERVMLGYQLDTQEAFRGDVDPDDPAELLSAIEAAARAGLDDLEVLRGRLSTPQPGPAAEGVRDSYVLHLDSWVDYLSAIEDDPRIVLGDLTRYTVHINRTGNDFVRAVDTLRETDVDDAVGDYAQQIVDRGFSGPDTPQA